MHEPSAAVPPRLTVARSELILGGQKSGKSRRAEWLAREWLATASTHSAILIATAQPGDDEMRQRIRRHQRDRAQYGPGMTTVEEPVQLADAILQHSRADTLLVVDCLTLWLTNLLMPHGDRTAPLQQAAAEVDYAWELPLVAALESASGPMVLVGNEIGLGVIPLGREARQFVDALGHLNQHLARVCARVTLMAAGLPLSLKEPT